jgi:hypothetical protein
MTEVIDDASYAEGRAAFATGASLRSIVEQIAAAKQASDPDAMKAVSGAIGFADALLDMLRGKQAPVHGVVLGSLTPPKPAPARKTKR